MGQKMTKPPIFYTIGQIQFSPVLGMAKFVPEIQESLRGKFPDFKRDQMTNLRLQIGGPGGAQTQIPTETAERWHFIDVKKTSGYILKPESLVFHTTAYETSDSFFANLLSGIQLVNKCAGLSYIESVAIRTLDAVIPAVGRKAADYLNPVVRGLSGVLEGELRQSVIESLWDIPPDGVLISRVILAKGALAFPMDLFPLSLELSPHLRELNAEHALLDNDRQGKGRFTFDVEEIRKKMQNVKKGVTEAFLKTVTSDALKEWK
jgi:uncharacterized protein (TIGR04255 family)